MLINKEQALSIIKELKKYYGNIKPDLNYENIFQLTVAVVLSAQTTDVQVNRVTPELFKNYPDFKYLAKAKIDDVEKIIHSTGFYKNKAKNIINLSKMVMERFNGELPSKRDLLMELPGVGRKSTNVILSMGFNVPAMAVDTHVARLSNRLGFSENKTPDKIEKDITDLLPNNLWTIGHLLIIKHGRIFCKAGHPLCNQCPIMEICQYPDKNK